VTLDAGAETTHSVSPALAAPSPIEALTPDPAITLEFTLAPADLTALARLPALRRVGPGRPARLIWYDDADQSIAGQNLSLLRDGPVWQFDRLAPDVQIDWPACAPPPPVARADDPAVLVAAEPVPFDSIPFDVVPISAFDGRHRSYDAGSVAIAVLHGAVRGVVETRPACRLTLTGLPAEVAALLPVFAPFALSVPRATLAIEASAAARGTTVPPRHLGAPALTGEISVGDGLASVMSHLLDVLLFWTDAFRRDRQPEAVHQARVATRRLRSALSLYRPAACPELTAASVAVKHCADTLGAARDWDVFLAGTGLALTAAKPGDPRIALLLRAATRQRDAGYTSLAEYLAGPAFRHLTIDLATAAVLAPWQRAPTRDPLLDAPTAPFAAAVLARRLRRVRQRARGLETLPVDGLHELRKDCKRLRYAAEFFAHAFPGKHTKLYLRRLSMLQEELGTLNDAATAGLLLAQLGRAGRGYAGGVVDGIATASAIPARARIEESWKRFKRAEPFWK
jgi:triphosphatase